MRLLVHWTAMAIAAFPLTTAYSQDHAFSVEDDIAMVRFSEPSSDSSVPGSEIAKPSPDGKYVAVVTTRGLLHSDQIESEIAIFNRREVSAFLRGFPQKAPKPRVIARVISFPHREQTVPYASVIRDLKWSPNGTRIYFRGENSSGAYQLYVANPDGRGAHTLTSPNQSVDRFDVVDSTVVYKASLLSDSNGVHAHAINADAKVVMGDPIQDVLFPDQLRSIQPETFSLWALRSAHGHWITKRVPNYSISDRTYLSSVFPFTLSPKGDKLIGIAPVLTIPDEWKHYEPVAGFEHLRLAGQTDPRLTSPGNVMRPQQYALTDLTTGRSVPLLNAPNARSLAYYLDESRLAWARDERRVLVTNTFLPREERADSKDLPSDSPCAVASVDLPSRRTLCLFFAERELQPTGTHVQDVSFGANNDEALVLLKEGTKEQTIDRYHLQDGHWSLISSSTIAARIDCLADWKAPEDSHGLRLQISVRQNLNDPPTLWAANKETGQARQLWDPNPQLRHVRFGDASLYRWKDKTGREWTGALVKPVDYTPGNKYPLVVQMYSFVDGQFLTDGLYPTAFAARHLASVGFVVLQIKKKANTLSEADPEVHLEGYRSAVDSLVEAGLVERSRVGVVGFSWTCWYVVNALIKDPNLFAAATIADGLDNSYMQYLLFGVGANTVQQQMQRIRGTSPFGDGLKRWMEQAPGFHLDQVQAPVRIEAINPASLLQEWELYASLRIQNKPVDLIYFPYGTHIHQKPLERLESQQGDVDWFRFWLQGYEDPDPLKQAQYERWRNLKTDLHSDPKMAIGRALQ
jgi:dipeptidyl aminopeptidase/acylaminoacyl peptidase